MLTIRQRIMRTVRMKTYARTKEEADALQARLNKQLSHLVKLGFNDRDRAWYDQPLASFIKERV